MDEIAEAVRQYQALCERVPLKEIRSEEQYDAAVAVLNDLLDAGGADENHPLAELVSALGLFIAAYEHAMNKRRVPHEETTIEMLCQDPALADEFLRVSMEEIGEPGGEGAFLAALRQVALARGSSLSYHAAERARATHSPA